MYLNDLQVTIAVYNTGRMAMEADHTFQQTVVFLAEHFHLVQALQGMKNVTASLTWFQTPRVVHLAS